MDYIEKQAIHLIGLSLKCKTFNANGQSAIDCGNLWQEFEKENISVRIPNVLEGEIYAVYYNYEGDHTGLYSYFIGCMVQPDAAIPAGLDFLTIPELSYQQITASGKMPYCVADAWQQIWISAISRAYKYDFELYDHRSRDWQNAEVDIFLSINR